MAKYKAIQQFNINIGLLRRTITHENFTDSDVEFLLSKFPNVYNHNFGLVGEDVEEIKEVEEVEKPKVVRKPRAKKAKVNAKD